MDDPRNRFPEGSLCRTCKHPFIAVKMSAELSNCEIGVVALCGASPNPHAFGGDWELCRISACTHYDPSCKNTL